MKAVAHDTTDHLGSDDYVEVSCKLVIFVHSFHAEIMVSQATRDGMFMRKVLELVLEGIKPNCSPDWPRCLASMNSLWSLLGHSCGVDLLSVVLTGLLFNSNYKLREFYYFLVVEE